MFVSLRRFASRNSCVGIAVLFVHAISAEHKVFKTCGKSSRYYVITHPSNRCQTSSKRSQQPQQDHAWSRSPVQQGYCTHCNFSWNFSQIKLKKHRSGLLQRSKLVLPNTKQWTYWFTSAESLSTYTCLPLPFPTSLHFFFFCHLLCGACVYLYLQPLHLMATCLVFADGQWKYSPPPFSFSKACLWFCCFCHSATTLS